MPFYEYRCPQCGFEKEVLHGISSKPELPCDACGEAQLEKLISAAGFRLKGSGWYETDFKSDKQRNLAGDRDSGVYKAPSGGDGAAVSSDGAKPAGDAKPTATSEAKSDAKPAAKSSGSDKPKQASNPSAANPAPKAGSAPA